MLHMMAQSHTCKRLQCEDKDPSLDWPYSHRFELWTNVHEGVEEYRATVRVPSTSTAAGNVVWTNARSYSEVITSCTG